MTPIQAIREKCLDCCCGSAHEVKMCACEDCTLYPFRFGKNPNIKKRTYTDEQRAQMSERIRKAQEARKQTIQS